MHPELESAFSLTGRTAVITGAANGIGRQAAITFAMAGANVVIADVKDDLAETARLVGELGGRAIARTTDVRDKNEVDALAQLAVDTFGGIDVWANVAGIIRYSKIVDTTEDTLRSIIDVNLIGVYWGIAAAARVMSGKGRGSIINIASAGGDVPAPNISVYGLTKAAVMHLTGTRDEFYPPARVADYEDRLRLRAANLEFKSYDAAHEIVPAMREDLRTWLARQIA